MKNKDKYDLTKLEIQLGYMTNGCGRKLESPVYVTIMHEGEQVLTEATSMNPFRFLMNWLERE